MDLEFLSSSIWCMRLFFPQNMGLERTMLANGCWDNPYPYGFFFESGFVKLKETNHLKLLDWHKRNNNPLIFG